MELIYYPVVRRYGNEIYDIREFVTPDTYSVYEALKDIEYTDMSSFIENSWHWVIRNINYPYFTNETAEFFDRHYMEEYIMETNTMKRVRQALINGAITGAARTLLTGTFTLSAIALARDMIIGNAVYSAVMAVVNNQQREYTPQHTYEQYDFWNFPAETLRDMTGDCEDSANLLCSILRNKLSEDEVFVTVGFFENIGHAWVVILNDAGQPIVLETTDDNIIKVSESIIEQEPYYPAFRYNDKKVVTLTDQTYIVGTSADQEKQKIKGLYKLYNT